MARTSMILRTAGAAMFLFAMHLSLHAADAAWEIKGTYPAPPPVDAAKLAKAPRTGTPRNIILLIGDGMGQGALTLASLYAYGAPGKLTLDQFPVCGLARTASANSTVTDSAASGTALAGGYKTNNGMIGKTPDKVSRKSFAVLARESGRSIGIMTTDALTGATPAAFLAHADHRSQAEKIAADLSAAGSMILIGSVSPEKGRRTQSRQPQSSRRTPKSRISGGRHPRSLETTSRKHPRLRLCSRLEQHHPSLPLCLCRI